MEVMIVHASTPKRIAMFNKAVSELKFPFEGKERTGYSPVFPYKVELWNYKMKKEVVPLFLQFVKGNTLDVSRSVRALQGLANFGTRCIVILAKLRQWTRNVDYKLHGKKSSTPLTFQSVDMKGVKGVPATVPGWGYSKVLGLFPDHYNHLGQEEL